MITWIPDFYIASGVQHWTWDVHIVIIAVILLRMKDVTKSWRTFMSSLHGRVMAGCQGTRKPVASEHVVDTGPFSNLPLLDLCLIVSGDTVSSDGMQKQLREWEWCKTPLLIWMQCRRREGLGNLFFSLAMSKKWIFMPRILSRNIWLRFSEKIPAPLWLKEREKKWLQNHFRPSTVSQLWQSKLLLIILW